MYTVTHFYNRPAHAIRLFDRLVSEQLALGRELHSLTHIYSLGTGIRLRFEFGSSAQPATYRLTYRLGRLRAAAAVSDAGWEMDAVVPMTAAWIPIGHFYRLKKVDR